MATRYNIPAVTKGVNSFANYPSDTVFTVKLAASTAASFTVPGSSSMGVSCAPGVNRDVAVFIIDGTAPVYCAINGTATVAAGDTFAASTNASFLLANYKDAYMVSAGDTISVISSGTPNVCVEIYTVQGQ